MSILTHLTSIGISIHYPTDCSCSVVKHLCPAITRASKRCILILESIQYLLNDSSCRVNMHLVIGNHGSNMELFDSCLEPSVVDILLRQTMKQQTVYGCVWCFYSLRRSSSSIRNRVHLVRLTMCGTSDSSVISSSGDVR